MEEFILKYSRWFPYCEKDNLIESMRADLILMDKTSEKEALNIGSVIVSSNICTDTGKECKHNCSGLCRERC